MQIPASETKNNLRKALAGESIARNKYTYFAEIARQNGDEEIAQAFEQMAKNEMMHAKFWFRQLFDLPETTEDCLRIAAQGERDEWSDMYPAFARKAREEGFAEVALLFEKVAAIEESHEKRFLSLLARKEAAAVPQSAAPEKTETREVYRCQFCGAVFETRPDVCNVCGAIGAFEHTQVSV